MYQYKYKYLSKYAAPSNERIAHLQSKISRSQTYWGVDSASAVREELYQCVVDNFRKKPAFWGRYLKAIPGISEELTQGEVAFLHEKGVKILPVYSAFKEENTKTYEQGVEIAHEAIAHAKQLGVPEGKIIFGDIEASYPVTEAWIRGFVNTFYPSGYRVGIYHDPINGAFKSAYCQAAIKDKKVREQTVLWSNQPELGTLPPDQFRCFLPVRPPCECFGSSTPFVWAWQYGANSEICPIDTNLIQEKLFKMLW
jgi:hypothetical protein